MVYDTPSSLLLSLVSYTGFAVFLAIVSLLIAIGIIRYLASRRRLREQRIAKDWQAIFFGTIGGETVAIPKIAKPDREFILLEWLYFTESIRGEARSRLKDLAIDLQLDRIAMELLMQRNLRGQLLAVAALGRLGGTNAWEPLIRLLDNANPVLSLLVVRTLLQIDAERGLPLLFENLQRHNDWPARKVAGMVEEIPQSLFSRALMRELVSANKESLPRLLSVAVFLPIDDLWSVLEPKLDNDQTAEVLIAALKASKDPRSLPKVRVLATDNRWPVRAQAAATLGRLGLPEDRFRLQAMLGDREWWVRYRAAQALTKLPFMQRADLESLCGRLGDHFAADMLRQALAEAV